MLGKLFNLTSGNGAGAPPSSQPSSKPVSSLESVQEDIHTRNLLFPDTQALYQHRHDQVFPLSTASALPSSTSNAFDYNGDIDMDTRDVRVVIMQDTLSSVPASLLYDSQSPPAVLSQPADRPSGAVGASHPTLQDARRNPTSPRKTSLSQSSRPVVIQPESPQPRQSAFGRRASVQGRTQSRIETEAQRAIREYGEEIATFSSCIFGNNEFLAYKGTSTKVHVMPSDPRNDTASSIIGDGRGSMGRSSMRSSKLSQSFSSEMVSPFNPPSSAGPRIPDRRRVLITRLFPVNIPDDNKSTVTPQGRYSEDSSGYPFPASVDDGPGKPKKATPKIKRTPMYAVALIINLPQGPAQSNATSASRSTFRGPSSYTEQESFPSSFSSTRRAGWTMVGGGGSGMESFDSGYSTDAEDRIDFLTQHWDIIMRTLTHLQSVVATNLFSMLKQADMVSPDPVPPSISAQIARTPSLSGRRSEDGGPIKPPKVNFKSVYLLPNCLSDDRQIKAEVDIAKTRIVSGLCAARVVTGQNRWGIWREEARWVSKWAGGREQGFFFFNLLTGFLSVHTDWLQALSPSKYRKQYFLQQKAKGEEDLSLPVRTIVIGQDKMAARRLVFLLSAFLPTNQQIASMRTHRPSTSASFGAFSQSPPSYIVPILKEESLRRKINRRGAPRQSSHSRNLSMQAPSARSSIPTHLAHLSMDSRHERRASDAASIKTTNIPILSNDLGTRKSSAATTTTITPETSIPHFATAHGIESHFYTRPGSSSSVAADDLKRSLKRGDSSGHYSSGSTDSRQSSRWGSVIGGLWGARKRDSTHTTTQSRDSTGSRDSFSTSPRKSFSQRRVSLGRMVEEAQMVDSLVKEESPNSATTAPQTPRQLLEETENLRGGPQGSQKIERTPDPNGAFESPVKTTINADDGVIDVDVPFPEYLTSFETAVSSPSSSGYLSTPGFGNGLEAFEQACRMSMDGDMPMNVAGWLQRYHPDFVLQAIPESRDLVEQVKASLRAEPTPVSGTNLESYRERWVDVSCALIADTTNFSISLIRYRRLVKPKPIVDRSTPLLSGSVNSHHSAALTPSLSPYERCIEEEFTEEPIVTLDETLIEAVERVVAQGADVSKDNSAASSRSVSQRRGSFSESTESEDLPHLPAPPQEVPRGECKTVVLSALEEIVRDVVNKRDHPRGGNGRGPRAKESVLKDAVRMWIETVEAGE